MKKYILSLLAAMLALVACAAVYMRVNTFDNQSFWYDITKVIKTDYETDPSDGTQYMNVKKSDGTVDKYDTDKIKYVDYVETATVTGTVCNHGYVDLGLESGMMWATCNVGAETPDGKGDFFAWGETNPKKDYSWETYKFGIYDADGVSQLKKYCNESKYGTVDNKKVLESEDDAATANWGECWRMPTTEEMKELIEGCDWEWTDNYDNTGVSGRIGTSKTNGNKIFLAAAGRYSDASHDLDNQDGLYWTSSLNTVINGHADILYFTPKRPTNISVEYQRFNGLTIRAVLERKDCVCQEYTCSEDPNVMITVSGSKCGRHYVDLGLQSGMKWATMNVGATSPEDFGDFFSWGEISTKEEYIGRNYRFAEEGKIDGSGNPGVYTKYCNDENFGAIDNKKVLDSDDDPAAENWGKGWRTPTAAEQMELIEGCCWKWTDNYLGTGVAGQIGTSKKNGNIIFLPAAGNRYETRHNYKGKSGYYWSSSLNEESVRDADYLKVTKSDVLEDKWSRIEGLSVRAVATENSCREDK